MLLGEPHQPLARPMHQLGVGRERHRLRLHRGVDDDPGEVRRLGRAGPRRRVQALLNERDELLLAHPLAPARQGGPVERRLVDEELFAAKELKVWVLDPARAELFVGEIVRVLEDRKPRHQPCGQRRVARLVRIDRAEPLPQGTASRASPSLASGRPMSTIWSSRARKRSLCPLSRRSFGRIANRSVASPTTENHASRPDSICKIRALSTIHTGKNEYSKTSANAHNQDASGFFTDDELTTSIRLSFVSCARSSARRGRRDGLARDLYAAASARGADAETACAGPRR